MKRLAAFLLVLTLACSLVCIPAAAEDLSSRLLAEYNFDNETTNDSVGAKNATLYNNAEVTSGTYVEGVSGKALKLSSKGTGEKFWLSVPYSVFGGNQDSFTLSMWYRASDYNTSGEDSELFSFYNSSAEKFVFYSPASMNFQDKAFTMKWDGTYGYANVMTPYAPNAWKHLVFAVSADGSQSVIQAYVDGEKVSVDQGGAWDNSLMSLLGIDTFTVGGKNPYKGGATPSCLFYGAVDEIRIYSGALTAAEAKTLYTGTQYKPAERGVLLAEYNFDEGNTADAVGTNDATFYNDAAPAQADFVAGASGKALRLSEKGTAEKFWLSVPIEAFGDNLDNFTLSIWYNAQGYNESGENSELFTFYNRSKEKFLFHCPTLNDNIGFTMKWDGTYGYANVLWPYEPNAWVHLTYVVSNDGSRSGITAYINGEKVGVDQGGEWANSLLSTMGIDTFTVGGKNPYKGGASPKCSFYGAVDEIRIYSGSLTAEEVAAVYEETANAPVEPKPQENVPAVGMSFSEESTYQSVKALAEAPQTFEATVWLSKYPQLGERPGVILGNYGRSRECFSFEVGENGAPRLYMTDAGGRIYDWVFDRVNVFCGEWTNLAIVKNGKKLSCFVNGILKQEKDIEDVEIPLSSSVFGIGGDLRSRNEKAFRGLIRDINLYSSARTADQLLSDSTAPGKDKNGLLASYSMDREYSYPPRTIEDLSGNGYTVNRTSYQWVDETEPPEDYAYSFAVIGDTQIMNKNHSANFPKIYDYVIDNAQTQNIEFVFGLGDITDTDTDAEWTRAIEQIRRMDSVVPYALVRGNHDSAAKFQSYVGYEAYTGTLNGVYEGGYANAWRTLEIGKVKYLIMLLDYGASDEVLAWAGKVIEEHPDYNVIVTTHAYLNIDGTTVDQGDLCPPATSGGHNNGDHIWEKLIKKHKNIVMVLSGHEPCSSIVLTQTKGEKGNTVAQLLIDPQDMDIVGDGTGMVAMMYFSEDGRQAQVRYYSTVREQYWEAVVPLTFTVDMLNADDPLHEHSYVPEVTEPTCTDEGYTTYTCACGASYTDSTVPALGHNYADGICTRCGAEDPNYEPKDPCEGYTDIDRNSWYHAAADFVLARGLMGSTKTDRLTFEPATACTRGMIATMLYSLEGKPAVTFAAKFPDVKQTDWFAAPVIWAYQNGVVTGYDNGKFGPNDKVTREQMAVILKAYTEKVEKLDTSKTADLSGFADADKVSWSKPFIQWAVAEGLLSGKANGGKTYLDPQGNATRAEVAAIMKSFSEKVLTQKQPE